MLKLKVAFGNGVTEGYLMSSRAQSRFHNSERCMGYSTRVAGSLRYLLYVRAKCSDKSGFFRRVVL